MGLFRRKRTHDAELHEQVTDDSPTEQTDVSEQGEQTDPSEQVPEAEIVLAGRTAAELGPFDSTTVPRPPGFLDLGSLWLPHLPGVSLMVETDTATDSVTGLRVQVEESTLQLQVFAAPKSEQLWDEIRAEILTGLTDSGGSGTHTEGPYGIELAATVPTRTAAGAPATASMRFLGVDGPRWFLRGVISGPAASNPELAQPFIDLLRVLVIHRGDGPMAPRELLPMHMPRSIEAVAPPPDIDYEAELRPFERGPEITEIH